MVAIGVNSHPLAPPTHTHTHTHLTPGSVSNPTGCTPASSGGRSASSVRRGRLERKERGLRGCRQAHRKGLFVCAGWVGEWVFEDAREEAGVCTR